MLTAGTAIVFVDLTGDVVDEIIVARVAVAVVHALAVRYITAAHPDRKGKWSRFWITSGKDRGAALAH